MTDRGAVDLRDLDRWQAEGPPFEWFCDKREHEPVSLHPGGANGRGFWVVAGHEEVTALGRCPHVLSSDADNGGVAGLGEGDELQAAVDAGPESMSVGASSDSKMLLTLDPPEHTANRKLLNRGFTPAVVSSLGPAIRELTVGLLDSLDADGVVDFTTQVAMPLPMQVIGDLLGTDRSTHGDLLRWSNRAVAGTDPEYRSPDGSSMDAAFELAMFFGALREDRDSFSADGLVSKLVDARIDGEPLSQPRYTIYLLMLAIAGNETTRNAMSHGVWAFAQHPEQWQRLVDDRSLIDSAVEEILRWASPVLYFRRNAIAEMTVSGVTIEPGDLVSMWYVSANRDEAVFDEPDRFDIGRSPNPHVSFGGGGPHFCLGASLARLELRVLLEELLERYRSIDLVDTPSRLRSNFLNGVKHLPVRLLG